MTRQEKIFNYLGIDKWHDAGYTGKGISILSMEQVKSQSKFPYVTAINGFGDDDNGHGSKVMEQMKVIAPDANYFTCSKKGSAEDSWKPLYLDYILKNKIPLVTTSKLSDVYKLGETKEKYMQECIDNGTTFFIGAGNRKTLGGKDIYEEAKSDKYLAIGACTYDDGDVGKAFYSCEGEELDYMTIVGYNGESGTSFATNRFCAMCALVQQMFLEKVGRTLKRYELEAFIRDNLKDLKTEGFDVETGYGLFILPDPNTIDVSRYVSDIKQEVGSMFNQNNYGNIPYPSQELPNATVKTGGCGLCCSANVLQHFGMNVDIKSLAEYFCDAGIRVNGGTDMAKAAKYIKELTGCEVITTNSEEDLKDYLQRGAIAIANVDGVNDIFSTEGHFINVIGVNDGTFTIFDVGYYSGKFDSEYRRKYVTLGEENGNIVQYCSADILNLDTANRNPNYYIFYRKEEVNMEEPSDWAKKAWEWACAKERKYFDGTNPKGTVTREMLAQVLFNLFGKEK